jgi:hypothetical protein
MATEALPPVETPPPHVTPAEASPASPVVASAPPDVPRPMTARVRRRAWTEPHVRFWWLLTAAMFVIGAYVCTREFVLWRREARLVREGRLVQAEIMRAGGLSSRWQLLPPDTVVTIQYELDGKQYTQDGYLKGRKDYFKIRTMVPVRVDPSDPNLWTARTEPPVLSQQLTGAAIVLPALVVLAVVSVLRRAMTMRTWRRGQATVALTVESRQTALAPRSRLVRCTPADRGDNRVVSVYVPQRAARDLRPGDLLWLIFPPGGRGRPVAAAWFDGGGFDGGGHE